MKCVLSGAVGLLVVAGCGLGTEEDRPFAAAKIDLSDIETVLQRVVPPLVDGGFGKEEIARVVSLAGGMRAREERFEKFPVSFRGRPESLKIALRKEGTDRVNLRFVGSPELTRRIDAELKTYLARR